jgi:hypothetical protein
MEHLYYIRTAKLTLYFPAKERKLLLRTVEKFLLLPLVSLLTDRILFQPELKTARRKKESHISGNTEPNLKSNYEQFLPLVLVTFHDFVGLRFSHMSFS